MDKNNELKRRANNVATCVDLAISSAERGHPHVAVRHYVELVGDCEWLMAHGVSRIIDLQHTKDVTGDNEKNKA